MDPTQTLAAILDLVARINARLDATAADEDDLAEAADLGLELAGKVADLHGWLAQGNFPPAQWRTSGPQAWR